MNFLFLFLCYSVAYTYEKGEVTAYRRDTAVQKTSRKEVASYRSDGPVQRSFVNDGAAQTKDGPGKGSVSAMKVAGHRGDGPAKRSVTTKEVAARRINGPAKESVSAKEVAGHRRDRPSKSNVTTKRVAAQSRDGPAKTNVTAKKVAQSTDGPRKGSASAKELAGHQRGGSGKGSTTAKKVAARRRNGPAKGSVAKELDSKQKVPLYNKPKMTSRGLSKNSKTPNTVAPTISRTSNRRGTKRKKVMRRIQFTRPELQANSRSDPTKKPVARYRLPTRVNEFGNLMVVKSRRQEDWEQPRTWRPTDYNNSVIVLRLIEQVVYSTQGTFLEKVERIAAKYKSDTRYRMAFILLKLDSLVIEMERRQSHIQAELVDRYLDWFEFLKATYPVRRIMSFYADMLRRNIDVTYAVEYVLRLYSEKAMEREGVKDAKKNKRDNPGPNTSP